MNGYTEPRAARDHFADRLAKAIERRGAPACVGLDPVLGRLPGLPRGRGDAATHAQAFRDFSLRVIDAVADIVPVVKFQSACYERLGPLGIAALTQAMAHARDAGLITILDAKRGDIAATAEHYAAAAFALCEADALTVSGYLGADSLRPFLDTPGHGLFVLVRTSNPGSDDIQSQVLADGRTVAHLMASMVAKLGAGRLGACGLSEVGAVVAATKPQDAAALRAAMPDTIFLVPGYGAQGGTADDVKALRRRGQPSHLQGLVVTASRSVIYAQPTPQEATWEEAVSRAARQLRDELTAVCQA